MRTLYLQLLFILAFFVAFALGISTARAAYPGECVHVFAYLTNTVNASTPKSNCVQAVNYSFGPESVSREIEYGSSLTWTNTYHQVMYWEPALGATGGWTPAPGGVYSPGSLPMISPPGTGAYAVPCSTFSDACLKANGFSKCPDQEMECPDGDNDGVCDACDSAPGDSTKGGSKYLKGWLERNGETVAFLTSDSQENETFDNISWQDAAINAPGVYPTFGVGGGAGYLFDDEEFVAGGGKFVFLDQVEKVSDYNCRPVVSLDQCSGACEEQIANEDAKEQLEDVPPGQEMAATTEQKMEKHPTLAPPDKCDDFYSRCDKACGGNAAVESRGCVSDETTGKVVAAECQCYHTGSLKYAESWEQLNSVQVEVNVGPTVGGVASGQSVSATVDMSNPGSGTGDDGPGGGPTDGDADGYADGYQMGDRTVNFGPLVQGAGAIGDRFPFSLATTIRDMANKFDSVGQCPQWELPVFGHTLVVDLCIFDPVAVFVRTLLGVVLGAATFFATMRLMM